MRTYKLLWHIIKNVKILTRTISQANAVTLISDAYNEEFARTSMEFRPRFVELVEAKLPDDPARIQKYEVPIVSDKESGHFPKTDVNTKEKRAARTESTWDADAVATLTSLATTRFYN